MLVTTDQPPVSDPISRPILDLCVFLGSKASVDKPLLTLTVKVGTVCVWGDTDKAHVDQQTEAWRMGLPVWDLQYF